MYYSISLPNQGVILLQNQGVTIKLISPQHQRKDENFDFDLHQRPRCCTSYVCSKQGVFHCQNIPPAIPSIAQQFIGLTGV